MRGEKQAELAEREKEMSGDCVDGCEIQSEDWALCSNVVIC
jgi:hypothetical protein